MKFKLYIEGGGDDERQATEFRQAWAEFFKRAGLEGRMPAVVRCGGREQTFDRFCTAVKAARRGEQPLLLVDAEDPLEDGDTVWMHLKRRDEWEAPRGVDDEQAFLMVQVMETWFLADRAQLQSFFGDQFKGDKIPQWPELEVIPKTRVLDALDQATRSCKAPYKKGVRSFRLLSVIDPKKVEEACPHASALLKKLRGEDASS